jgi:hypothetical protein
MYAKKDKTSRRLAIVSADTKQTASVMFQIENVKSDAASQIQATKVDVDSLINLQGGLKSELTLVGKDTVTYKVTNQGTADATPSETVQNLEKLLNQKDPGAKTALEKLGTVKIGAKGCCSMATVSAKTGSKALEKAMKANCEANCDTCSDAKTCTKCKANYTLQNGDCKAQCLCANGKGAMGAACTSAGAITCASCSPGFSKFGIGNATYCQATCASHTCQSGYVVKEPEKIIPPGGTASSYCSCQATCASHNCQSGYVVVNSSSTVVTPEICCQATCASYTCPSAKVAMNPSSISVSEENCCQVTTTTKTTATTKPTTITTKATTATTKATTTTPASTTTTEAKVVRATVKIANLNFTALQANATAMAQVKDDVTQTYLDQLPTGYTKSHVHVTLTAGSVVATVVITPLASSNAAALQTTVQSAASAVQTGVQTKVQSLPKIAEYVDSGKSVNDLTVVQQTVVVATTTTATTTQPTTKSTTKANGTETPMVTSTADGFVSRANRIVGAISCLLVFRLA